jgi:hypothetical protein
MYGNKRHYSKPWKPVGLSKTMDPEMAKRLAKFQGLIVFFMGLLFLFIGLVG